MSEDMSSEKPILFTKQMRAATREVHSLSDALINAKLGIALGSDAVWAEGLLVFYEVFQQLEDAMDRLPDSLLAQLDVPGIRRSQLFQKDLDYYLGNTWRKNGITAPRESVAEYIAHLEHLECTEPVLLLAYAYHLYMGLLSGGQILRRKKALINRITFSAKASYEGLAVAEITVGTVAKLKKEIAQKMNDIAEELDEETKEKLLKESRKVFELNDTIVRSIKVTNSVVMWKLTKIFVMFSGLIALAAFLFKMLF